MVQWQKLTPCGGSACFQYESSDLGCPSTCEEHGAHSSQVRFFLPEHCQDPSNGQAVSRGGMAGCQDAQALTFANTGIKHASIVMADVGARVVHAGICTLRTQALSIGTSTHSQDLTALTKNIPISTSGLFGDDLSKVVAKAASASCNYDALADSFVLSGLPRPRPRDGK